MSAAALLDRVRSYPRAVLRRQVGNEPKRLYWSMAAVATAMLPHLGSIALPVLGIAIGGAIWRVAIEMRGWRLPPRWARIAIALASIVIVLLGYRTLNGLEAGTGLLVAMVGAKLLETRGTRDCTMLIFIGFMLLFAALLYNQSLLLLPYILLSAWILVAALLRLHQAARPASTKAALKITGIMLLQALPIAALLFVFFPRLPMQFWSLPARGSAATGLDDQMTPGDISELSLSSAPAFRVKFEGTPPPPSERYWRGPVLHEFDGRSWRREPMRVLLQQPPLAAGPGYRYRITLEPTQRNWLIALDVPTDWTGTRATRTYDWQLITRRPLSTLSSFTLVSHPSLATDLKLPITTRRADTALPGSSNPRTRALARTMRDAVTSDWAYIQAVLGKFRNEEYFYTLAPPFLGDDSADDFLFETRRGFCEHFASAFAVLMRGAGIPTRIVTGYQGGEFNSLGEYLLVRQSDAHAWNEVWLDDRGWIRIDPTAAVAPERIERNLDAALGDEESVPGRFLRRNAVFAQMGQMWDAVNNFWNDRVVQYNEQKQRSFLQALGVEKADWRDLGVAIGVSLAAFFAAMGALLGWRYRPRRADPLVTVYAYLCRKLARSQLAKSPHEGPVAYLRRVAIAKPEQAAALQEVSDLYVALRYGPDPLSAQLSRLKYLVNVLRV